MEEDELYLDHLDLKLSEKGRVLVRLIFGGPLEFNGHFEPLEDDDE